MLNNLNWQELYKSHLKALFDFFISIILLVLLFPVLIIVTILLLFVNKGKPLFIQTRPGKHGKFFKVIKFKTMNDLCDKAGTRLPDAERLTFIGKFIRKTSFDEIPQLLNVIKGDMSLIGPRPLLVEYLPLYNNFQKRRHEIRPGITGLAQVNGRNTISWEQKFKYDVHYVDYCTFLLDVKILLKTIQNVVKSEGITQNGQATIECFGGTKN